MKTSTKIWLLTFTVSLIGTILLSSFVFTKINIVNGKLISNFNVNSYVGLTFLGLALISGIVLYLKFLNSLKLTNQLIVITVPLSVVFAFIMFSFFRIDTFQSENIATIRQILNITEANNTKYLWMGLTFLLYLLFLFLSFYIVCKPLGKVEKIAERLSDGRIKNRITIGGGKQFKDIEYSFNKINDNYKAKENLIKQTNLEYEKFVPKQFLKYLGKESVLELELGNKVKKEAVTMFCDIRNSTAVSVSLSLEENFTYINSYLNIVAPIVRKFGGFVDKYLGDGILAVFTNTKNAIECAHAITKSIELKNSQNKKAPNLDVGISLHAGEIVFGVVGEEARKSPTIISDSVNFAGKMEEINKNFGSILVFSKTVLNSLPSNYPLAYRFIGSLKVDNKGDNIPIFESLESYPKKKRDTLLKHKTEFEEAVRKFEIGKFSDAKNAFQKVYRKEKEDKVCYLYYNKCIESEKGGRSPLRLK